MYSKSSFNGIIEEIPDIFVDNFVNTNKKAYFLSHCHTDHTKGLYNDKLVNNMARNGAKIYMTEESMKIVNYEAKCNRNYKISDYIHTLKYGTTTVTVGDQHIEVTLIPAGHCIGSVMFLFKIPNKTILYTGDFRIRQNDVHKYLQLHKKGNPIRIDVMYVDTTFIHEDHPEFAKRSDSVEEMLVKIDEWLKEDENNRVAIHTSASYGYEFVYDKIYKRLGEKVYIGGRIWDLYMCFPNLLPALKNVDDDAKIHLCVNIRYRDSCVHNNYTQNRYLSVLFSAMSWRNYDDEMKSCEDSGPDVIKVLYATHCSRSELLYFVNYLDPVKVVGFPNPYNPRIKEIMYMDRFTPSPKKKKLETEDVPVEGKADRNLLKEMFGV